MSGVSLNALRSERDQSSRSVEGHWGSGRVGNDRRTSTVPSLSRMAGSSAVKEEEQENQARQGQGGSSGQRSRKRRGQPQVGEQDGGSAAAVK